MKAIVGKGFFFKSKYKSPALPFAATTVSLMEEHLPGISSAVDSGSRFTAPWLLVPPKVDISLSSKLTKSDPPSHILAITDDHVESSYTEHLNIYILMAAKMKNQQFLRQWLYQPFRSKQQKDSATGYLFMPRILSDSLSALQSLSLRNSNSRPDLRENILSIYDQCHLNKSEVVWCPAHVGLTGNELADGATRRALEGPVGDNIPLATKELYSMT